MNGNIIDAKHCIKAAVQESDLYELEDNTIDKLGALSCAIGSVAEAITYLQAEKRHLNKLYKKHEKLL